MNAPMESSALLIIGGGPGGYVAAIRAGQLGISTTLVEAGNVGGTCLNIGCIPSKALIHAAEAFHKATSYAGKSTLGISVSQPSIDIGATVSWKDGIVRRLTGGVAGLLKKHGVRVIQGRARIIDGKTIDVQPAGAGEGAAQRLTCEHLLLATGSESVELPFLPFGGPVISSTEALSPSSLPETLAVVGGGYIGLELGTAYRKLGVRVSVIEAQDRILPSYDAELSRPVAKAMSKLGMSLHVSSSVSGMSADGNGVTVRGSDGHEAVILAERILVAVGRRPCTQGFGLESLQLDMNGRALRIDDQCRTSMRNVWAIGDVAGEPMLAHRAMAQGEMVAEIIAGQRRRFVPASIPAICFTDPEIVVAGMGPEEAAKAGLDCISAMFPFAANGRAMTLEAGDGFVRVVARRDNHLIVGWQAVGRDVSELATAFSQSLEMGARLEDVAGTIHAHPSLGEAVQEAALRALGHALHI
jgi:dihydrolipoamide dehydrogenase